MTQTPDFVGCHRPDDQRSGSKKIIAPGKPQQNGRLERFHRTLKGEATVPPAADYNAQQRVFDLWRGEYNHERPHEALGQRPPGRIYQPSKRRYPRPLIEPEFDPFSEAARVDKNGCIRWLQRSMFISSALKYEYIELDRRLDVDGRWDVRWGQIPLGYLDEHRPQRGLVYPRRRRGAREVSGMSYG
ncbi:MAG: transposase [Kofleriaceae bacterium]|nr:transposase [Kofleriaceae bacterium]